MKLIIYGADVVGVESNCRYPHRLEISNAKELTEAILKDHVCAEYKNNYRGNENFIRSNFVVMDVDNDHTENPAEWITPESLEDEYASIQYAITFSRHHMKPKEGKSARPRFHVYFWILECTDAGQYAALKKRIREVYPFYEDNALDAGRFIYGSKSENAIWHEGELTIDVLVEADEIEAVIPEGSRNRSMFQWAAEYNKVVTETFYLPD